MVRAGPTSSTGGNTAGASSSRAANAVASSSTAKEPKEEIPGYYDNDSDSESSVSEKSFGSDDDFEYDAVKYAVFKDSRRVRDEGWVGWHYGIMWKGYLKTVSDTEEPFANFEDEDGNAPLITEFWKSVGRKIPKGKSEPPGKMNELVEAPEEQLRTKFAAARPKRDWETYQRRRQKELLGQRITKADSDYYWRKKKRARKLLKNQQRVAEAIRAAARPGGNTKAMLPPQLPSSVVNVGTRSPNRTPPRPPPAAPRIAAPPTVAQGRKQTGPVDPNIIFPPSPPQAPSPSGSFNSLFDETESQKGKPSPLPSPRVEPAAKRQRVKSPSPAMTREEALAKLAKPTKRDWNKVSAATASTAEPATASAAEPAAGPSTQAPPAAKTEGTPVSPPAGAAVSSPRMPSPPPAGAAGSPPAPSPPAAGSPFAPSSPVQVVASSLPVASSPPAASTASPPPAEAEPESEVVAPASAIGLHGLELNTEIFPLDAPPAQKQRQEPLFDTGSPTHSDNDIEDMVTEPATTQTQDMDIIMSSESQSPAKEDGEIQEQSDESSAPPTTAQAEPTSAATPLDGPRSAAMQPTGGTGSAPVPASNHHSAIQAYVPQQQRPHHLPPRPEPYSGLIKKRSPFMSTRPLPASSRGRPPGAPPLLPHGGLSPLEGGRSPAAYGRSPLEGGLSPVHGFGDAGSAGPIRPVLPVASYQASRDPRKRGQDSANAVAPAPVVARPPSAAPSGPISKPLPPRTLCYLYSLFLGVEDPARFSNRQNVKVDLKVTSGDTLDWNGIYFLAHMGRFSRHNFIEAPKECIDLALAQGASVTEWASLCVPDAKVTESWETVRGYMRNSGKVYMCTDEAQAPQTGISAHRLVIVALPEDAKLDTLGKGTPDLPKLSAVAMILTVPLAGKPLEPLPNPIRPDFLTGEKVPEPAGTLHATGSDSIAASYGLTAAVAAALPDATTYVHPASATELLYQDVVKVCNAKNANTNMDVAILLNAHMSRIVLSSTITRALARRTRYFTIGPNLETPAAEWGFRPVWKSGGLVTFSPTFILQYPDRLAQIMVLIAGAPGWEAYIPPSTLLWFDESWQIRARCREPSQAYAALTSFLFDEELRQVAHADSGGGAGIAVSYAPPQLEYGSACTTWLAWLTRVVRCTEYTELVALCKEAVVNAHAARYVGRSPPGPPPTPDLISVERALLKDLTSMRMRPDIVPYRRFVCIGGLSVDEDEKRWSRNAVELVSSDDFVAVLGGAV